MLLGLDTETTGVDLYHASRPFFVTTCQENGEQLNWEWWVDPLTREVRVPPADVEQLNRFINTGQLDEEDPPPEPPLLLLQNAKFDVTALEQLGIHVPWHRIRDTLLAGHLLSSNTPHDLTSLGVVWLGRDIAPYEKKLEEACKAGRRLVRSKLKNWAIATEGMPGAPSIKSGKGKTSRGAESESPWKCDTWLPRALCFELNYPDDHPWWTVLAEYASADSAITLALWKVMEAEIRRRGLEEIYAERLKCLPVAHRIERRGITISSQRLTEIRSTYVKESTDAGNVCRNLAAGRDYDLMLPKGGNNKSLVTFCFDVLKLPVVVRTKTGGPSLNKEAMEIYGFTLPPRSAQRAFVTALKGKRVRDTAVMYMDSYHKFWRAFRDADGNQVDDWYVLHPFLNPTGTDTLRWSCNSPNEQNISKKEGFNLRYCFGPAPGREWWSLDARNIELRLPTYECGEEAFIALFERPDDPPYFGSNHLLICHIIHPKLFEECRDAKGNLDGRIFKKRYASTWYQRVKNGNFAVQYGAIDRADGTGTADRAYGVPGAQALIKARFKKQEALNQHWIRFAEKHGYVETMPDRTVNPHRGYPLVCSRTEYGKIKPTVPLNYHTQGSAMWWMGKAMVRCEAQLEKWRNSGFDGYLIMQVHDELVFDFPASRKHPSNDVDLSRPDGLKLFRTSNLWRVKQIQRLMEEGGRDLGVPTPVSIEYHPTNWSEGVSF